MQKMRIHIGLNGETKIRVINGDGENCKSFTAAIENAVGSVVEREHLPEYHEESVVLNQTEHVQQTL